MIGAFAKKYNVNISAVRYYIEKALLMPKKQNNQYIFDKYCMEDMEKILKYKSYHMTLEEIELMFFMEKTSNYNDETILQMMGKLLSQKQQTLEDERDALGRIIEQLEEEKARFMSMDTSNSEPVNEGIPLGFSQHLCCPKCHATLNLDDAHIIKGKVCDGKLYCDCGYSAGISNGIIYYGGHTDDSPFKLFDKVDSVMSLADECSDNYRLLVDKTYLWMYQQLDDYNPGIIMTGSFTSNFLLKNSSKISKDTTIIIIDPSIKRIAKLRQYLAGCKFQLVYIAGSIENVPIQSGCVDAYIDDFSVTDHIFTYGRSIYKEISRALKPDGIALGIYCDYSTAPRTMENIKKDHLDFNPGNMRFETITKDMNSNTMNIVEKRLIGQTTGSSMHFPRHSNGEQVTLFGYKAQKTKDNSFRNTFVGEEAALSIRMDII